MLSVKNLVKQYPDILAVNNLSFDVYEGECFGLLGPNGAGKSTTIEILENVITADSGEVLYFGQPRDRSFSQHIGIQFQNTALQDFLTVRDTLKLFSALYHKPVPQQQLIESCALQELLDRDNRKLSGGQRQRLLLALALINNPALVFLDEPTTGLDPQARRNFWHLIEQQKSDGKTILLTTHYMDEAEVLCDRIAIVDRGQIVAMGSPSDLLAQHLPGTMIKLPKSAISDDDVFEFRVNQQKDFIEIMTENVDQVVSQLLAHSVNLDHLTIKAPTLEDLFIKLTGHGLRE
ncbi:MAG: ABC transporter ATP-binding protein [Gammaproteobacteria bacterium]|nr:ABC transporter ATP-binding protein [Gammaproteobacteria bacterium]